MPTNDTPTVYFGRDPLEGWTIEITTVRPCLYRLRASDQDGVRFCVTGTDPGELRGELDGYVEAAGGGSRRRAEGFRLQ